MKKLGTVPIPRTSDRENKANQARQALEELVPGQASLSEFEDAKEAANFRSMLATMAILKFGNGRHLSTKRSENMLYIWLVDAAGEVQFPLDLSDLNANHPLA